MTESTQTPIVLTPRGQFIKKLAVKVGIVCVIAGAAAAIARSEMFSSKEEKAVESETPVVE